MNARKRRRFAMLADRLDLGRFRQERAHHGPVALGMKAEIVKGIGVAAFDDRIGLGGQFGHEASLAVCRQYSKHPGQRDAQPFRPVGQFVFDLVERLFKQKEIQHPLGGIADRPATAADWSWSRDRRRGTPRSPGRAIPPSAAPSLPCSSGATLSARSSAAVAE